MMKKKLLTGALSAAMLVTLCVPRTLLTKAETTSPVLVCDKEEHTHSAGCYKFLTNRHAARKNLRVISMMRAAIQKSRFRHVPVRKVRTTPTMKVATPPNVRLHAERKNLLVIHTATAAIKKN